MEKAKFYADLNPRFPSRGESRWAVFVSYDTIDVTGRRKRAITRVDAAKTTSSRKSAEAKAALLGEAWVGGSLAVDHRYAPELVEGMRNAGLVVSN